MRVCDEVFKSVVFLAYSDKYGNRTMCGTAFIVQYLIPGVPMPVIYFVTARHVLERIRQKGVDGQVYLRINSTDPWAS